MGTTVGTVVAYWVVPLASLGPDAWKMAAALMARHIGGAAGYEVRVSLRPARANSLGFICAVCTTGLPPPQVWGLGGGCRTPLRSATNGLELRRAASSV